MSNAKIPNQFKKQHIKNEESSPVDDLQSQVYLLNTLYIRNKNQHHRSIWWKHFNIFRKQLNELSKEISIEVKVKYIILLESGQNRIKLWIEKHYISDWYFSFSQIIKERRFTGIGLVLISILSKIYSLLKIEAQFDAFDQVNEVDINRIDDMKENVDDVIPVTDIGEVIQRELRSDEIDAIDESEKDLIVEEIVNKNSEKDIKEGFDEKGSDEKGFDENYLIKEESKYQILSHQVKKSKNKDKHRDGGKDKDKINKINNNNKKKKHKNAIDDIFASFKI